MIEMEKFARRLTYLRHSAQLKQRDIAERCSVSVQTVSKWERGYSCPDVLMLDDLSAALEVEIKDLFLFDSDTR